MFKLNDYKIVFKRRWHNGDHTDETDINKESGDGRYDTVCEIYVKDKTMVRQDKQDKPDGIVFCKEPSFTGIARLHPNDKPDKIVGKRIALFKAMDLYYEKKAFYNAFGAETKRAILCCSNCTFGAKEVRTAIWEAFNAWVKSWACMDKNDPTRKEAIRQRKLLNHG